MRKTLVILSLVFIFSGVHTGYATQRATRTKALRVKVTAYCPCSVCCGRWSKHGLTANGNSAYTPGVAVDHHRIDLGTPICVPGYNQGQWVEADDTGRKVKGRHIDIRMRYHSEAVRWGRRWVTIYVEEG